MQRDDGQEEGPPPAGCGAEGVEALEEGDGDRGFDERHGQVPDGDGEVGELDDVGHGGEGDETRGSEHFKGEEDEGGYGG